MKKRTGILLCIMVLTLVSLSCGTQIYIPNREIKTGPIVIQEINIPDQDSEITQLHFDFGAGEIKLSPGDTDWLVQGTATFNVTDLAPEVITEDKKVTIRTGNLKVRGLPDFQDDIVNKWNFTLTKLPLELFIDAGAYQGEYEFGNLALRMLEVNDGAAKVDLQFSAPNQIDMEYLKYQTGASSVNLTGLSNANFQLMTFRSGAGNYSLNFSGLLRRDAIVRIESGISKITIIVPKGVPTKLIYSGGFTSVDMNGEWQKEGSRYILEGIGPSLIIEIEMGAGKLVLKN